MGIDGFEMLHHPALYSVRIGRVDYDKVRPKGRLKQRHERGVRHDDHVFAKSNAGVEFEAARRGQASPNDAQHGFCVIQLLGSFRF
jgi:hypothetical protein